MTSGGRGMTGLPEHDAPYLTADAEDARFALEAATRIAAAAQGHAWNRPAGQDWLQNARSAYRFLRSRDSLRAVSLRIIPGTPVKEGTTMTATISLADTDEVPFSLGFQDAKGGAALAPDGFSAAWSLSDPDSSGAVLTASADDTTAVLAAGTPTVNIVVSVSVSFTDENGGPQEIQGAEAVIVQAGEAATVAIVAGTPVPES